MWAWSSIPERKNHSMLESASQSTKFNDYLLERGWAGWQVGGTPPSPRSSSMHWSWWHRHWHHRWLGCPFRAPALLSHTTYIKGAKMCYSDILLFLKVSPPLSDALWLCTTLSSNLQYWVAPLLALQERTPMQSWSNVRKAALCLENFFRKVDFI